MDAFLAPNSVIDSTHPLVRARAEALRRNTQDVLALARTAFLFVRDEISHSGDSRAATVSLKASEVLQSGTGWCFAKSHLLAALLRANGIPAGLCYQRLVRDAAADEKLFTLHGFNAVWLPQYGWYRCDPRGNKPGVGAEFVPPVEQLAWRVLHEGELDFPAIYPEPVAAVVSCLTRSRNYAEAVSNMPDAVVL